MRTPFYQYDPNKKEDGLALDKEGQVRMKKHDSVSGNGAPSVVYLRAAIVLVKEKDGFDPQLKHHSTLIRQTDGTWKLKNAETGAMSEPLPKKRYVFVTMLDGTIRVAPKTSGGHGHAQVSGYAPYVKYAGEVMFENGKELHATPQSGTYLPPLEKARQYSGFNCDFTESFPKTA